MQKVKRRRKWLQILCHWIMAGCKQTMGESQAIIAMKTTYSQIIFSNDSVRVMFKAGKNQDGYFTNDKILEQADRAMDILDKDYLDDTHVFFYDNAKTHTVHRPDTLSA
jgi:hypothetical protein